MKIALLQLHSTQNKEENISHVTSLLEEVIEQERPEWICLPEVWTCVGGSRAEKEHAAEEAGRGMAYRAIQDLARQHRVFIHAGSMLERGEDDFKFYNTTFAFNDLGEEVARYRKIHLFDVKTPDGKIYTESAHLLRGTDIATYMCHGFKIGCAICYDIRFPLLFQALMDQHVDLIALPAAFTLQTGKDHWEILCRARAIETQAFFCACAQTGSFSFGKEKRFHYGHSLVVDPWGYVQVQAGEDVTCITTRLDKKRLEYVRRMIPLQKHKQKLG